jgi:excisionase family DNA binding protein
MNSKPTVTDPNPSLSPRGLATRWSFHVESCRRMIREGRLPALRIGKRLRVKVADVEAFEIAHSIKPRERTQFSSHTSSGDRTIAP